MIYLNDVLLPLSHMLGEESIPSQVPQSRLSAVQFALNRIFRLYPFDWERKLFVTALTNGVGTLDSSIRYDSNLDVYVPFSGTGDDQYFQRVPYAEFDMYSPGQYKYYISYSDTGLATLVTTETSTTSVNVRAELNSPVISQSQGVIFPDPVIVARFALVFIREWEDKDADTSVEEAKAKQALEELISRDQRSKRQRAESKAERTGHYTGEVPDMTIGARFYS